MNGLCFGLSKHFIVIQNKLFISILNCSPWGIEWVCFINIKVEMTMIIVMGIISSSVEKCCQEMWNIYKHTTITSCIDNLSNLEKKQNCSNDFYQYVFNSYLKYKCITIHT